MASAETEKRPKLMTRTNIIIVAAIIVIVICGIAYEGISSLARPSTVTVYGTMACGSNNACPASSSNPNQLEALTGVTFGSKTGQWSASVNADGAFTITLPDDQNFSVVGDIPSPVQQGTATCTPNGVCYQTSIPSFLICNAGYFTLDTTSQTYSYHGACNGPDSRSPSP